MAEGKKIMRTTTTFLEPVRTEVNDVEIDETSGRQSAHQELKRQIAALNSEIDFLKRRIKDLEAMLSQEKLTISRKVTEYEARINSQIIEIQNLKADNSKAQSVIHSYQNSKTTTSSAQEHQLRGEIESLRRNNDALKLEIQQRSGYSDSERRAADDLRAELQNLREEFARKERKTLSDHTSALDTQSRKFQDQIQAYQNEIKRMNEQIISVQATSLPQNEQILGFNKHIKELSDQLATSQSLQRISSDQLNHEKDQNRMLSDQIKHLKDQVSSVQIQSDGIEGQNGVLRDQLRQLKDQLRESQEATQTANSSARRLQDQIETLRDQLAKTEVMASGKSEANTNSNSKTVIERNYITQLEHPGFSPHLHAINAAYIQETEAELAKLRSHIMKLQNELSLQQTLSPGDLGDYQARIHKLRLDLEQAQDQAIQESRKAAEYKKALEASEHENIEQIKQIEHYKSEAQEAKWRVEKADQQTSQLQRDLKFAQEEKDRSKGFNEQETKLRAQIEILMRDLQNKDDKIEKLTLNYANLSAKLNDLSETTSKRDTHTRDDEATYLIKEENDNLRRINSKLLVELNELRGENNNLRSSRSSYQHHGREYQELSQKLMFLESKMASDKENGRSQLTLREAECSKEQEQRA
jgi:chromosome segregation ATPase